MLRRRRSAFPIRRGKFVAVIGPLQATRTTITATSAAAGPATVTTAAVATITSTASAARMSGG